MTTVFNGAGEGSAKASWVLMRRTRADTFRSANRRKNLHRFSMLHVAEPKNLTCIGPHPRTQKNQRFQSWKPAMSGGLKLRRRHRRERRARGTCQDELRAGGRIGSGRFGLLHGVRRDVA